MLISQSPLVLSWAHSGLSISFNSCPFFFSQVTSGLHCCILESATPAPEALAKALNPESWECIISAGSPLIDFTFCLSSFRASSSQLPGVFSRFLSVHMNRLCSSISIIPSLHSRTYTSQVGHAYTSPSFQGSNGVGKCWDEQVLSFKALTLCISFR